MSERPDALLTNVVLVQKNPPEARELDQAKLQELVGDEIQSTTPPDPSLNIGRQRVKIDLTAARISINKDYPKLADLSRLSEVIVHLLTCMTPTPTSFPSIGHNIQLVYPLQSSTNVPFFLRNHVFREDWPAPVNWHFIGSESCKLTFNDAKGRLWTFTLEPRFGRVDTNKLFVNVNLHISPGHSLQTATFQSHLELLWEVASKFIDGLDKE